MMQADAVPEVARFEFEGRYSTPLGFAAASAFSIAFMVYLGIERFAFSPGYVGCILGVIAIILFSAYIRIGQVCSDLTLDPHGLSKSLFSIRIQGVRWEAVKQIRVAQQRNPGDYRRAWFVRVYTYDRQRTWRPSKLPIVFNDRTQDRNQLIDLLNRYADTHGIEVFEGQSCGRSKRRCWRRVPALALGNTERAHV